LENFEVLEEKYKLLKEQMINITKLVEDEKTSKQNISKKQDEDLKNFENKIKKYLQDEREVYSL
jgi:hypothetical protein